MSQTLAGVSYFTDKTRHLYGQHACNEGSSLHFSGTTVSSVCVCDPLAAVYECGQNGAGMAFALPAECMEIWGNFT